jgi:hypothetical protein
MTSPGWGNALFSAFQKLAGSYGTSKFASNFFRRMVGG